MSTTTHRGTSAAAKVAKAVSMAVWAVLLVAVALPVAWRATPAGAQTVTRVEYVSTPQDDSVAGVDVDGTGNVYAAGITWGIFDGFENLGGVDGFVRKYGATGVDWTVQFGTAEDDDVAGVAVDGTGNVYVAGYTYGALSGANLGSWDGFVQKYSADGELVWQRQFGTDDYDQVNGLAVTSSGDVYVAGYTSGGFTGYDPDPGNYDDGFLRAYDSAGTELWTRQFGTEYAHDEIEGVAVDPTTGTVVVAGNTQGDLGGSGSAGAEDAFVRTYSSAGVEGWTRQFGTAGYDSAGDVAVGPTGQIHVAVQTSGAFDSFVHAGGYDGVVRTYSSEGVAGWTQQFGTANQEYVQAITVDGDGVSYVVTDVQNTSLTGSLRTFAADGTPTWTYELTDSNNEATAKDVAVDSSANVYIGGSASGALPGTTDPDPANTDGVVVVVRELQVTAPAVTLHPQDATVTTGDPATFTAAASGEPTPTVQWEESTDGVTFEPMTGETSTTLSFTADLGMDGYEYRAVFTNTDGFATTNAATLTVDAIAPVVTVHPDDVAVFDDTTATFTATASGVPTPTVQWEESTDGTTWVPMTGKTSTTLSFTATLAMDGNQYRAVFTNTGGSDTTNPATLTVTPAPTSAVTIDSATVARGWITVVFTPSGTPLPTQFECNLGKRGAWVPCESGVAIKASAKTVTVRGSADGGVTWVSDTLAVVRVR